MRSRKVSEVGFRCAQLCKTLLFGNGYMPLFREDELESKQIRVTPNISSGSGHEVAALWLSAQAQPLGTFFWNLVVSRAYANQPEWETAIALESMRRESEGLASDRVTVMKYLILKSGLFKPRDPQLLDALGLPLLQQQQEEE